MKIDEIKLLYEYNYWANQRILTTCANVSEEQYIAVTNFGSLRPTVIHILDSEWSWRLAFQEHFVAADELEIARASEPKLSSQDELTEADLPTLDSVKARWQVEEQAMRAYLDSLADGDLNGVVRYLVSEGYVRERVLWHCLVHAVNHGTQHRSEAAALLTSYEQSPGGLDFTAFLNEHFNLPS